MKKLISLTFAVLFSFLCFSEEEIKDFKSIQVALKLGNASNLSRFLDDHVLLKTDSKEGSFTKKESTSILKEFFNLHKPEDFVYDHKGSTPNGVQYAIGTYSTASGTYSVYMKLDMDKEKNLLIKTLDFTKE